MSIIAAIIGSWEREGRPAPPAEPQEEVARFLTEAEEGHLASLRLPLDWHPTPNKMLTLLSAGFTVRELIASPRLLARDEETTLYVISGSLQKEKRVYDVAGEVITRFCTVSGEYTACLPGPPPTNEGCQDPPHSPLQGQTSCLKRLGDSGRKEGASRRGKTSSLVQRRYPWFLWRLWRRSHHSGAWGGKITFP